MAVGRFLGVLLIVISLLLGFAILRGAMSGFYALGLIRTWILLGTTGLIGTLLLSFCSGVRGADIATSRAGGAYLLLGLSAGVTLALSVFDRLTLRDSLQPWMLLIACVFVGSLMFFGGRS